MAYTKDRFQNSDRKNQIYSDFLDDLNPHPVTGDIVRYVNENAVSRSIRNLILTNKGERLYQPNLGSDIFKMLFEPMSDAISQLLSSSIQDLIAAHEPRAKVISVDVAPDYEGNAYAVTLQYMIINRPTPISLNVSLTRVR
jgi:phage baseplate assembly protein W